MNYFKGDIFNKKNIIFKDTSSLDLRLHGHPIILPVNIKMNDEFYYFFVMSSQIEKIARDRDRYFIINKGNGTGLTKTSIVDLKYVYKNRNQSQEVRGNLSESKLVELMERFQSYNEKIIDEDCGFLLETF